MKKTLLLMSLLPLAVFAQEKGRVGINEGDPKATLEISVSKENESTNTKEGILIPRVTAVRAKQMGEDVTESTMVFIKSGKAEPSTTISEVNGKGFYYFDTASKKWRGVGRLNTITGNIRKVSAITKEEWEQPNTFALVQTTNAAVQLPDPANYINRIISVNNQYTNKINYAPTYSPANASTLTAGKGHILMSDGEEWYIIGGSY
ncbi:hypothetical protein [Ornithobacterium rhinotracheale]|uniref:hypothetical protein n=1 Tax=Ornithobacterium rhinotracheale TaxID=28251 RepID=UPI001FF40C94|nr:hypothetical protein [Ornithobacterium rhinotracheale]MCK0206348.1 hypothetical protein [Ornithobacterium rhinotracheale]